MNKDISAAMLGDHETAKRLTDAGVLVPCMCGRTPKEHGPEDWKPTFYDPDSGGDPVSIECECGVNFMCDEYRYFMFNAWKDPNSSKRPDCMGTSMFCPNCGRPLTDEAVEMVMKRMEALNEDNGCS